MSKRNNISYVKPDDPSFLAKLKAQIGYKEGPVVDSKRQKLEQLSSSEEEPEEKPQIVVIKPGRDLSAEQVSAEVKRITRERENICNNYQMTDFDAVVPEDISSISLKSGESNDNSKNEEDPQKNNREKNKGGNNNKNSICTNSSNINTIIAEDIQRHKQIETIDENMASCGQETEEDDSQLTSSTETKTEILTGDDEGSSINGEKTKTSLLGSPENNLIPADPLGDLEAITKSEDEEDLKHDAVKIVSATTEDSQNSDPITLQYSDSEDSRPGGTAGCTINNQMEKSFQRNLNPEPNTDNTKNSNDSVVTSEKHELLKNSEKENGTVISIAKDKLCPDSAGVVNLDDSDDDIVQEEKGDDEVNNAAHLKNFSDVKDKICTETNQKSRKQSDEAVVIASDSEPESSEVINKKLQKNSNTAQAVATPIQGDEDDDDDCVVIEDDPMTIDSTKRKGLDADADELPPNKRHRSMTPSANVGQLTIKDARTLMPQDATAPKNNTIYPVTITSATGNTPGPPKLVPMSTPENVNTPTNLSFTGLPSMTNNANLLPGLTDDMFVLEAPSFIVPYIYEKPPTRSINNIVKEIESKYSLTAEDLAEADKSDEFDMTTEQNKVEKPLQESSKKKKKDDNDDSWSEQSEEDDDDDDDDDSESGLRTKVLIKEANDDLTAIKGAIKSSAALAQSGSNACTNAKPGQENYFESPLGKFFMDIGVGLVQEFVQSDLLRLQKRKLRKSLSRDTKDFELAINALSGNLQASREKNSPFKFTMKRCEFCNFKSESALSMANHYETPHMNGVMYKCNFCTFEIRNATEIVYHMEAMHNIKARLIKPLPYHQCPNCGFEDNGKAKLARHQPVCAKKFRPELNLAPPNDWEAPAKIPRIKPRHGLVGTATAYQAMAAQAAAQKAALATIQAQQAQAAQARNLQAAALAAQNAAKMRARTPNVPKPMQTANPLTMRGGQVPLRNPISTNVVLPNNYQLAAGQLVQAAAKKTVGSQPSISITPLPRQNAGSSGTSPSTSKTSSNNQIKPGQNPSGGSSKAQFVICEICDGYIKDLEQLRNHMQWMHKVKIHPKMIYNRPPLNCQKCQFRFFTDQGLERHLLGSHGLVTSSMQEAANKGKDAGRCPICGRMYQWKLLNHVSRDHHMTLKPAHLSYKCTVCTATFGMYKQFETHVYTAHSSVAKKAMDNKKNAGGTLPGGNGTTGSLPRNSLGANDALLKPLKINDEITIIPQPASKPRITNIESHVID